VTNGKERTEESRNATTNKPPPPIADKERWSHGGSFGCFIRDWRFA